MIRRASPRVFAVLVSLSPCACSSPRGRDGGDQPFDAASDVLAIDDALDDAVDSMAIDVGPPPPMSCRPGITWDGTQAAFDSSAESTAAWGLGDARGAGLGTPDLDGDGWADLVVLDLAFSQRSNLAITPPVYHVRVYKNRPRDGAPGRRFVDATETSNLLALHDGSGYGRATNHLVFADVDNDGDVDAVSAVFVNTGTGAVDTGDRSLVMLNDGNGVFALAPDSAITGSTADVPQTGGVAFTDQDLDGNIDVFVGYWYDPSAVTEVGQQHQLFRGHGDGTFDDATSSLGLDLSDQMSAFATAGQRRPLYGVSACDLDGDGRQELMGAAYGRQWNFLYVNQGDHYSEVGRAAGVAGDDQTDFHDDQSYRCYCQAHATDTAYCPPGTPAPIYTCPLRGWRKGYNDQPWRLNGNTFSLACGDIDNDGDMDLYSAEIHHPDVGSASDVSEMLLNDSTPGNVHVTRPGRASMGLTPGSPSSQDEGGLGSALFDFDDDGRLDAYLGASDYPGQYSWLYHQNADGRFTEIGARAGFHHPCPHGMAIADFDHDGDLDVIVGSSTARNCATSWPRGQELRVYENHASMANWTSIRLVGRGVGGANVSAIGARVRVTAGGTTQTREVMGVWGHFSGLSSELPVHVGLGSNCTIDRIEVRWPDRAGTVETFDHVEANYRLEIRQGEGQVRYSTEP